jgi:hypothetical protein
VAPRALIQVKLDERSYNKALERLKKYEGKPFEQRMIKAHEAGGRLLVPPLRRAIDLYTSTGWSRHRGVGTGQLRKNISMRKRKPTQGYIVRVGTKSRAPHHHLVAKGHRIVTPGGRDTGRRTEPRPFNEKVIEQYQDRVVSFIAKAVGSGAKTYTGGITSF